MTSDPKKPFRLASSYFTAPGSTRPLTDDHPVNIWTLRLDAYRLARKTLTRSSQTRMPSSITASQNIP